MELFASSSNPSKSKKTAELSKKRERIVDQDNEADISQDVSSSTVCTATSAADMTFQGIGMVEWICSSIKLIGFRYPTPIQASCIPAILSGKDVIGCAETGSGKTAAFALPILQDLSQDIYGIFAIVLTPTRELAMQISDQFIAFGNPIGVRVCLIIGGENMMQQSVNLSRRPHIVIATPGRLRHHLEGPEPPPLSQAKYLVLDECDRLLSAGFSSELEVITSRMSPNRQTLLFSATMTSSLQTLEQLAMRDTLRFDLTHTQRVPEGLIQEYLFLPSQMKTAYLVCAIDRMLLLEENAQSYHLSERKEKEDKQRQEKKKDKKKYKFSNQKKKEEQEIEDVLESILSGEGETGSLSSLRRPPAKLMIIFVGSCRRCQEVADTLTELDIDCVALHGMMSQQKRSASLSQFKSQTTRILVATDVASRGLDIPSVDFVVNLDLPRVASDYVHRAGRTARAGRTGHCLSLVTERDIALVHAIEAYTSQTLSLSTLMSDEDVLPYLNRVSKASRLAQQKLLEAGFDEKEEVFQKRKKQQKRRILRKSHQNESQEDKKEEK